MRVFSKEVKIWGQSGTLLSRSSSLLALRDGRGRSMHICENWSSFLAWKPEPAACAGFPPKFFSKSKNGKKDQRPSGRGEEPARESEFLKEEETHLTPVTVTRSNTGQREGKSEASS